MCLQIGLFFDNHWEGIREARNMSHYKKKLIIQKFFLESFHYRGTKKINIFSMLIDIYFVPKTIKM